MPKTINFTREIKIIYKQRELTPETVIYTLYVRYLINVYKQQPAFVPYINLHN